ncbi:MAG: DUF4150 domain-containing protein [Gammaproteobacteria bacterium]|nr:DUF4150 domain-containing protein [Gammaproteobacteria bacterium]MYB38127.1 DUF4150 domain-containing protein [Gammaproteobacteria bacterium]
MTPQTFGAGSAIAQADVCKTPSPAGEVPVAYPNTAMNSTAVPAQYQIMVDGQPILTLASNNPTSAGDESGVGGGVVSSTIKGPCMSTKGSLRYIVGGSPAVRTLDPTSQNLSNSMGSHMVPSQTLLTVTT